MAVYLAAELPLMLVSPACPKCGYNMSWGRPVDRLTDRLDVPWTLLCGSCGWSGAAPRAIPLPIATPMPLLREVPQVRDLGAVTTSGWAESVPPGRYTFEKDGQTWSFEIPES